MEIRFGKSQTLEQKASRFTHYHGQKLQQAESNFKLAFFEYDRQGNPTTLQQREQASNDWTAIKRNTRAYRYLKRMLKPENLEQIKNPVLKKHLQRLFGLYYPKTNSAGEISEKSKMSAALGRKTRAMGDLHTEAHRQFKPTAWGDGIGLYRAEAGQKTYGEKLLDLVRERNRYARACDENNYFEAQLKTYPISPEHLDDMLQKIQPLAGEVWKQYGDEYGKIYREIDTALAPYYAAANPEQVLHDTARLMGLSLDAVLAKSDLYMDMENNSRKSPNPAHYAVNAPTDLRVIANVSLKPEARTQADYMKLLHEVIGHVLDYQFINPKLPPQIRKQNSLSTEGQATMFQALVNNEVWLKDILKVPTEELSQLLPKIRFCQAMGVVYGAVQMASQTRIEWEMYCNPDQNLDEVYTQQLVTYMDSTKYNLKTNGKWANTMHFATHPAYTTNYLIGYLWAVQVESFLNKKFGGILTPDSANYLKQQRSTGILQEWPEQIEQITGKPLDADALIETLNQIPTLAKAIT
jgi:hypothetical protein